MELITATVARAALVSAIAEKGEDYVYPGAATGDCFYSVDGEPSCIVGVALSKLGTEYFDAVSTEEKAQFEKDGDGLPFYCVKTVPVDDEAANALSAAQAAQDAGMTWGEALLAFDRGMV